LHRSGSYELASAQWNSLETKFNDIKFYNTFAPRILEIDKEIDEREA
jgi:hypothetical protein